jgi:leader peptidase (prepilin peptidase)/N-methyltransferase
MFAPVLDAALAGVFGLLVGSFLNVVIHRLPAMMHREWLQESLDNLDPAASPHGPTLWELVFGTRVAQPAELGTAAAGAGKLLAAEPPLTLSRPRSRCGSCGAQIRAHQNVPVLSWIFLRGKCAACGTRISVRYPFVELLTGALFAFVAWRYGLGLAAAFWAFFCAVLVCQFFIDLDTQLLPDTLNYLLLWAGLLGAAMQVTGVQLASSVWGAALGYLSLWLVYHLYRLATGKHGMGHGDFKLLAALGAWLGAKSLLAIILLSTLVGAILGGVMLIVGRLANRHVPIAFGPFLAAAGLVAFVLGQRGFERTFPFAFPF